MVAFDKHILRLAFLLVCCTTVHATHPAPPGPVASGANLVEVGFDQYGTPHILADTDEGAGYVAARDRWFQMCFNRLHARGRLAEYFGEGRNQAYVKADFGSRTWDWARHADRVVARLDPAHLALLQAYVDGANEYIHSAGAMFHDHFATYHVLTLDPWTPQDCILIWLAFGNNFVGNGGGELTVETLLENSGASTDAEKLLVLYKETLVVDHAAVIQESDVDPSVRARQDAFAVQYGINQHVRSGLGQYVPTFSNAMVIQTSQVDMQGKAGTALLWGGPRVQCMVPNLFYEWHMRGASFDVRGIGLPGSPNILIGSSHRDSDDGESFAWSMTAAGSDLGDLFRLKRVTLRSGDEGYLLNGNKRPFSPDRVVQIKVNRDPGNPNPSYDRRDVTQRGSVWGPVITALLDGQQVGADEEYAACYTPITIDPAPPALDAVVSITAMYRATSLAEWWQALDLYIHPSANMVFAASDGSIGYTVTGPMPVRKALDAWAGILPQDGSDWGNRWQRYLPGELQPRVENPAGGYLYTANHLPIGSWYPMLAYYNGLGDSGRSYRLRKLVEGIGNGLSFDDIRTLTQDRVNSIAASVVEYALVLRDTQNYALTSTATLALGHLEPWWQAGGHLDGATPGAVVARQMASTYDKINRAYKNTIRRSVFDRYGVRGFGMMNLLAEIHRGLGLNPVRLIADDEAKAIDALLSDAWRDTWVAFTGRTLPEWPAEYQARYFAFGSDYPLRAGRLRRAGQLLRWGFLPFRSAPLPLDPANQDVESDGFWLPFGPNIATYAGTMADIPNAAYNQFVRMGIVDGAESMLAVGTTERPNTPHFRSHLTRLAQGKLKLSPTSDAGMTSVGVDLANMLQFNYP